MFVVMENGKPIKVWMKEDWVEFSAMEQLKNMASLPCVKYIRAMPDVHTGKGATVGSVIATSGAIVPSMVGVDIGCGMTAVRTSLTRDNKRLDDRGLNNILKKILKQVPVGTTQRVESVDTPYVDYLSETLYDDVLSETPNILDGMTMDWKKQIGTLGGGNHFIELSADEEGRVWVMLHTGSRGIGKYIADYYIKKAKELCKMWMIPLVDSDLAYLPNGTKEFEGYLKAVTWCQNYAKFNREMILRDVLSVVEDEVGSFECSEVVSCHHNYIALENHFGENLWVTRKGAVRAREGELGIIPGSMGDKSYIVRGKGNKDSLCSCSHGAGRRMSRAAARAGITMEMFEKTMEGVVHRKGEQFLDEAPLAYKNIDTVMENQKDLVEVVHTLKQFLNVKG